MPLPHPSLLSQALIGAVFAASTAVLVNPASAQTAAFGKGVYADKAFCAQCHGWAGDGNPEDDRAPRGANLRNTKLTIDQIREVMVCGRPATRMPYFDRRAWSADLKCYDMVAADIGKDIPPPAATNLIQRETDSVLLYLQEAIIGKGKPSREECFAYWGAGAGGCAKYQTAAEIKAGGPAAPAAATPPAAGGLPAGAAPAPGGGPH